MRSTVRLATALQACALLRQTCRCTGQRWLTGYHRTCRTPADDTVPGQADTPSGHDVGLRGLDGL
jgi:hypothetical protein